MKNETFTFLQALLHLDENGLEQASLKTSRYCLEEFFFSRSGNPLKRYSASHITSDHLPQNIKA